MASVEEFVEQLHKDIKLAAFYAEKMCSTESLSNDEIDFLDFYCAFEDQLEVHLKNSQSVFQGLIENVIGEKKKSIPYDWYRGMKDGKEEVRWFNSIEKAKEYFNECSTLENLGNNFMKVF
jgi:hypothetical protein